VHTFLSFPPRPANASLELDLRMLAFPSSSPLLGDDQDGGVPVRLSYCSSHRFLKKFPSLFLSSLWLLYGQDPMTSTAQKRLCAGKFGRSFSTMSRLNRPMCLVCF